MDNKEFDEIIKKKLESLGSPDGDHWDDFKEIWDANQEEEVSEDATENELFDEKIKNNLDAFRMPFNSDHWIRLKEQLEAEALFRKRLYVAKTVEIIMLAMLVISIINIWPIKQDVYEIPVYDMPMATSVAVDKTTAENYEKSQQKESIKTKANTDFQANLFNRSNILNSMNGSELQASNEKNNDEPTFKENLLSQEENELNSVAEEEKSDQNSSSLLDEITRTLFDIDIIEGTESEVELPFRPVGYPDITLPKPEIVKEDTYLNVSIGPKVNVVNSPFDPVYKVDPYNVFNTNFSITATIDRRMGPVDLYAGLGYSNTSYEPLLIEESYEEFQSNFQASLENIQFKTFEIPIGAKFNMVDTKEFDLYLRTGIDLHLIAKAKYDIKHERTGSRNGPKLDPKNNNSSSKLSQKSFTEGIFQGGSLSDNLYATATIGIGMNKSIGSRYGIYLEPKYNHFISAQGIGPNDDKIHAFSMDLGVRYLLN